MTISMLKEKNEGEGPGTSSITCIQHVEQERTKKRHKHIYPIIYLYYETVSLNYKALIIPFRIENKNS